VSGWDVSVRSQARPRVAKVHRLCNEEAKQFAITDHSREWKNDTTTQEDGAATRQFY
jgi:hypothetical protein